MNLALDDKVRSDNFDQTFIVEETLGEGGQGIVYLVSNDHGKYALKWYNLEQSTLDQRQAIQQLIRKGPPSGTAGSRFVWPIDIVSSEKSDQFGYLMDLIDTNNFAELGEVWALVKPSPAFDTLAEISYQTASSFRALHLSGYCYRDISTGNLLFDPSSGDVLICDNDNVGINRASKSQVWGTMEFMAPEVVRLDADPSTETDSHSLAVLLFLLWIWHHPLDGSQEYNLRSWDIPAKRLVYGDNPVFIFDPDNRENELPNDPRYQFVSKRWNSQCPPTLKSLFNHAFTAGLHDPADRVTEGQWQSCFLQLKDGSIECPTCRAVNLWDPKIASLTCWNCQHTIPLPPVLVFIDSPNRPQLLLTRHAKIFHRHLGFNNLGEGSDMIVGEVAQHPTKPDVWGIRNLTDSSWLATYPDGTINRIEPQQAAPISRGLRLDLAGKTAEISTI